MTTSTQNVAIGACAGQSITTGNRNVSIGAKANYVGLTTAAYNITIGYNASCGNFQGNHNILIGRETNLTGNFASSVAIGTKTQIQASNYLHIGSTTYNLGSVVTASCTSSKYWKVYINGTLRCVLLV
jgi:hypothetical protein